MTPTDSTDAGFDLLADFLRGRTGLVFPAARRSEVVASVLKVMARWSIKSIDNCIARLQADAVLLDELIADLTIGETYFFRDPGHFSYVRDEVLPDVRRRRGAEHVVRAWCAGCSSGEEAYSLAILFEEIGLSKRASILATDISRAALARAQQAVYGSWALRGEAAQRLIGTHLRRVGERFQLAERFRRQVEFAYLNLAEDVYPTFATNTWGMDLILCRNVLIYLDAQAIRRIARRLFESLADGGVLITGPSDPLLTGYAPFDAVTTPAGVIYRSPHPPDRRLSKSGAVSMPAPATLMPPSPRATQPIRIDVVSRPEKRLPDEPSFGIGAAGTPVDDVSAVASRLRSSANAGETEQAATMAAEAAARYPTSVEIGFLHGILLLNLARYADAERTLRRVLYLDRSLAIAHFTLGAILHRLGNVDGAARAYRNARDLARQHPEDALLALSDGERADRFAEAAAAQLAAMELTSEHAQ